MLRPCDELVSFLLSLVVPLLDMVVEKNLRGLLRSEVDRSVSRDSIIIVDSLNNIKVRVVSSSSSYFLFVLFISSFY